MLLVNKRALEKRVVGLKNEIHKLNSKSEEIRGKIKSESAVLDCLRIKKGNLSDSANSSKEELKKSALEINSKNPALEKTGL